MLRSLKFEIIVLCTIVAFELIVPNGLHNSKYAIKVILPIVSYLLPWLMDSDHRWHLHFDVYNGNRWSNISLTLSLYLVITSYAIDKKILRENIEEVTKALRSQLDEMSFQLNQTLDLMREIQLQFEEMNSKLEKFVYSLNSTITSFNYTKDEIDYTWNEKYENWENYLERFEKKIQLRHDLMFKNLTMCCKCCVHKGVAHDQEKDCK